MSAAVCVSRFVTTTPHPTRSLARKSSLLRRPTVGNPLFLELVRELVEVGFAAQDELFLRVQDGFRRHRTRPVAALVVAGTRPVRERVDEPGLALGLPPDHLQRLRREHLPGFVRVLVQKRTHLLLSEVSEAQGLCLDVEGAAADDDRPLGARVDAVVAHVADAAEDDAVGKVRGPVHVAGPQLARKSPHSPSFRRFRSTRSAVVFPVCLGACSTKYRLSRTRVNTWPSRSRSRGGT